MCNEVDFIKQHAKLLLLFAFTYVYILTTDVIILGEVDSRYGGAYMLGANVLFVYLALGLGYIAFPLFYKILSQVLNKFLVLVGSISMLCLFTSFFVENIVVFFVIGSIHVFANGVLGSAVYFFVAIELSNGKYTGRVTGLATALFAILQMATLGILDSNNAIAVTLTVFLLAALFLQWSTAQTVTERDQKRKAALDPSRRPPAKYLILLIVAVVLMFFIGGINDNVVATVQSELALTVYKFPRMFYVVGVLVAGFLADLNRRHMQMFTLLAMLVSIIGILFLKNESTYIVNLCIFMACSGAVIAFISVTFMDLAVLTKNAALWAGMGRAIRLFAMSLAAPMSSYFYAVPFEVNIITVVAIVIVLVFLFIYVMQESKVSLSGMPVSGLNAGINMDEEQKLLLYRQQYKLTKREAEVLAELLKGSTNCEIAATLFIGETTVKTHVSSIFKKTACPNRSALLAKLK